MIDFCEILEVCSKNSYSSSPYKINWNTLSFIYYVVLKWLNIEFIFVTLNSSLVEIYKERVRDLLTKTQPGRTLRVREHPTSGPYVDGKKSFLSIMFIH